MPYTSVSLIAPLDDCEGGIGGGGAGIGGGSGGSIGGIGIGGGGGGGSGGGSGPEIPVYPSANFEPAGCCFVADFNLACQSYSEFCGVWASQRIQYGYTIDAYKSKISYRDTPGNHNCDCIKVQTERIEVDRTNKVWWVARHKLIGLRVHVGKTNVTCTSGAVGCKFYVAVSYIFEDCDMIFDWLNGLSFYPEFTSTKICTGVYRNGTCSFTSTLTENSSVNNCTDMLANVNWDICTQGRQRIISRIKIFDTMPTGQVSITNADLPPVSCCGGQTGCTVTGNPCGLYLISNCMPNLPQYEGTPQPFFCQDVVPADPELFPEECVINTQCPSGIMPKVPREGGCEGYTLDAESGCYKRDYSAIVQEPGYDQVVCGYCDTEAGRIYYDVFAYSQSCGTGICLTGDCCLDVIDPTIQTVCREFNSDIPCRIDFRDLSCQIDTVQKYTTGAFCYNLPTVTIEL